MNTRVKQLRESLDMNQEQFGKLIGLTKSSISNIEKGIRNVTQKHIKLICSTFNVNEAWIISGSGEMFNKIANSNLDKIAQKYKLDELDIKIIYEYIQLSEKNRAVIKEYILNVANNETDTVSTMNENSNAKNSTKNKDIEIEQEIQNYRDTLQVKRKYRLSELSSKNKSKNA